MSKVSKLVTSSDGCEIFAEGAGNLEGPTIVLVHGLGSSTVIFNNLFKDDQLLSKVYLVRYDMRSHGRSGRPANQSDYSSPKFAADFMAVVEGFNRQKPYLLGWSLGGTVATDVCTHCPAGYVSGIIYVSALPYIGAIMMDLGKECLKNLHPRLLTQDAADALKARIDFVDSTINDRNASNWDDRLLWVGAFSHLNANDVLNAMSRQQDPEPLLAAGRGGLRLLHLYGDADQQLDNAVAEAQVSQHFIDKKVVVIKGGGHALFYEFQGQVVEEVLAFVTK
ncbi:Alpha/Beta hydrolase protein [Suillus subaureus]|uniref:Alpha/Beta hydrolase protein n=1 Tax=Suillus subaureus TaxID=48587 RepID=A0A9P7E2J0_9AGAM|nr:Alpha/Beta hydrolase protein [Suillus subaureus]KAG1809635.1 Alpha/Beta hydrolase protein [Suillus subaureus]